MKWRERRCCFRLSRELETSCYLFEKCCRRSAEKGHVDNSPRDEGKDLQATSDVPKIFRGGTFNLRNASLCLSLLTRSRRTQSFTGCCCSILALLPGVASAPAVWGRGCVRTVLGAAGKSRQRRARQLPVIRERLTNMLR